MKIRLLLLADFFFYFIVFILFNFSHFEDSVSKHNSQF